MPASTPLDKIESNDIPDSQASDEERVQRIIQEMNGGAAEEPPQQQQHHQEPPGRGRAPEHEEHHYQQQMPPPGMMMQQQQPMGPRDMPPHQQMYYPPQGAPAQQQREPPPQHYEEPPAQPVAAKKNIWAHITDALKLPFVVAFVFFLLSLPVGDVYLAKYAPWAFSSGGHLSYGGLALKAVVAGAIMGVYDTLDKYVSRFF